MSWPLVSWILSSSSSSTLQEEEDTDSHSEEHTYPHDYDEEDYFLCKEEEEEEEEDRNGRNNIIRVKEEVVYDMNDEVNNNPSSSTINPIPTTFAITNNPSTSVTIAVPGPGVSPTNKDDPSVSTALKRRRITRRTTTLKKPLEEKISRRLDESRNYRFWTRDEELKLLNVFLVYTTERRISAHHLHQNEAALFYEKIKSKFQNPCSKNQLVDKLRRLRRKHQALVNKTNSGENVSFKSPHDQSAFEIANRIWGRVGVEDDVLNDGERANLNNGSDQNSNGSTKNTSLIEEILKGNLSPLFKDLLSNVMPPLSLNRVIGEEEVDGRWRNQQVEEMEVYLKRLELVQEQIRTALQDLRSKEG